MIFTDGHTIRSLFSVGIEFSNVSKIALNLLIIVPAKKNLNANFLHIWRMEYVKIIARLASYNKLLYV